MHNPTSPATSATLTFSVNSESDLVNAIISLNERYASIPTLGGQIPAVVSICQPVQLTGALPMLIAQGQTNVSFVSACANCTISGANAATGGSENWYPIFSIAAGGVTISGLTLQYGGAQGLAGGSSNPQCGTGGGGGGGMGAGGALFVGSAANVTMIDCNFLSNVACGGGGGQAMDEDGYDGAGGFGGSLNGTNYKCGVAGAAGAGAGGAGSALGAGGGGGGGGWTVGGPGGAGAYGGGGGGGGGSPPTQLAGPGGSGGAWAGSGGGGGIGGGSGGGGAGLGGAIFVCGGGVVTLQNCATSGNLAVGGPCGLSPADGHNGDFGAGAGTALFLQGALATIEVDEGNILAFQGDTIACDANSTIVKQGAGTLQLASTPQSANNGPFATPANLGAVFGSATINIAAGTLAIAGTLNPTYAQPALGCGPLTVQTGASLSGWGYFSNAITIAPGGTLEVTGPFSVAGLLNQQDEQLIAPGSLTMQPGSTLVLPFSAENQLNPGSAPAWPNNLNLQFPPGSNFAPGLQNLLPPGGSVTMEMLATWSFTAPEGFASTGLMLAETGWVQVGLYASNAPGNYIVTSSLDDGSIGTLRDAINRANAGAISTIGFASGLAAVSLDTQLFVNANVSIVGPATIGGSGGDRLFFVVGGKVAFSNLTLQGGQAFGGDGPSSDDNLVQGGGGGGAGLGGAVLIAAGSLINGSNVTLPTAVSMEQVSFVNNSAQGGIGTTLRTLGGEPLGGGGGGLGGGGSMGAMSGSFPLYAFGFGAGGGIGSGAAGGMAALIITPSSQGGMGSFPGANAGGAGGGPGGGSGGTNGGGGGGAELQLGPIYAGGGGGVDGQPGGVQGQGGLGGWGGGGGGGAPGGFGGGGGCNAPGGFGGGGGYQSNGGFGGGDNGGGGAGLGGAIFLEAGAQLSLTDCSFSGDSAIGGQGAGTNGMGGGAALFLGGDIVWSISQAAGEVILGEDIGGGLLDARFRQNLNAQGALTKAGPGMLTLSADNTFGTGSVEAGTLNVTGSVPGAISVADSAILAGTGTVGTITIDTDAVLQPGYPGQSVGALSAANAAWKPGGNYNWMVAAGVNATLELSGSLDLSGLSAAAPFNLNLWSLSSAQPPQSGPLGNFDATTSCNWTLVTAQGGITGFSAGCIVVNVAAAAGTDGFSNTLAGSFSVVQGNNGTALILQYSPLNASWA